MRKDADINTVVNVVSLVDAKVSLVDETQGRSDDTEMFNTDALIGDEVFAKNDMTEKEHDVIPKKVVIQKPVHSTVTTTPLTIPKAKCITFRDAGETTTRTPTSVSSLSIKDKGKAKMIEPEVPLNKNDQIRLDEELARRLDAEEQEAARLERENVELQEQANLEKIKE
ncbi:hypothetical protein Tco_1500526, partial [Tanacetum coccineum]